MVTGAQVTGPYCMQWYLVSHYFTAYTVEIQLSVSVQLKGFSLLSIQGERDTKLFLYKTATLQLFQLLLL
jgi:hypothetical protein